MPDVILKYTFNLTTSMGVWGALKQPDAIIFWPTGHQSPPLKSGSVFFGAEAAYQTGKAQP